MIVKNLKKYFTFEIQVLDDKNVRRRFRASNFQVCKSDPCLFMFYYFPDGFTFSVFFCNLQSYYVQGTLKSDIAIVLYWIRNTIIKMKHEWLKTFSATNCLV